MKQIVILIETFSFFYYKSNKILKLSFLFHILIQYNYFKLCFKINLSGSQTKQHT